MASDESVVRWDPESDVYEFDVLGMKGAYWNDATDFAGRGFGPSIQHLREKTWWSAEHHIDLLKAMCARESARDLTQKVSQQNQDDEAIRRLVNADADAEMRECAFRRGYQQGACRVVQLLDAGKNLDDVADWMFETLGRWRDRDHRGALEIPPDMEAKQ